MFERPLTREPDGHAAGGPSVTPASILTPPPQRAVAPVAAAPTDALGSILARAQSKRRAAAAAKSAAAASPAYVSETFSDAGVLRTRTTKVTATVKPTAVPARGKTPVATAYEASLPPLGFDGGHVIGLHLGGRNVSDNVVPMYPRFNRGVWKTLEDEVKRLATPPAKLTMAVTITYGGPDPGIPSSFTVDVLDTQTRKTATWTLRQPQDIKPVAVLPDDVEAALMAIDAYDRPLSDPTTGGSPSPFLLGDEKTFEAAVAAMNGTALPASSKALYPDKPKHRYYSYLDILVMNGSFNDHNVPGVGTMGAFSDFSAAQRELLLQVNMYVNDGVLKSDDPADPHQALDPAGSANAPEIDHIIPKVMGGSNFFSNARVVSWELNNKEDRIKSIAELVDVRRLAAPSLPSATIDEKATVIATQWRAFHPKVTDVKRAAVQAWMAHRWPALGPIPTKKMIDSVIAKLEPATGTATSPPKRKEPSKGIKKPDHKRARKRPLAARR